MGQAARHLAPGGEALQIRQALLLGGEPGGHLVEGDPEAGDLVAARGRDARVPVARAHAARTVGQRHDPTAEAPSHHRRKEQREQQYQPVDEQERPQETPP